MPRSDAFKWWLLLLTGLCAVVLGSWGSYLYLAANGKAVTWADALYRSMQLFTFNLYDNGPYPWQLRIASWLAPAVTLGTLFSSISRLLGGQLLEIGLRRLQGHTVLIGHDWPELPAGTRASPLILARPGAPMLPVRLARRQIRLQAPDEAQLIQRSGAVQSRMVLVKVAAMHDALVWIAELNHACLERQRKALEVTLVVDCADDLGRLDEAARHAEPRLQVRMIRPADLVLQRCASWVARCIAGMHPAPSGIRLRIVGDADFCTHALTTFARLIVPMPDRAIDLQLPCTSADWRDCASLAAVVAAMPDLSIDIVDFNIDQLIADTRSGSDVTCFHLRQPQDLPAALAVIGSQTWSDPATHWSMLMPDMANHAAAVRTLFVTDDVDRHVFIFGDIDTELLELAGAVSPSELLAQMIHENYLRTLTSADAPAARPWSELPARYRSSTRLQAQSMDFKLAALGYTMTAALAAPDELAAAIEAQIERLAEAEHRRWMTEKRLAGWTHGASRNEAAKTHPCLVPFAALPETEKEKDRVMWRQLVDLMRMTLQHAPAPQSSV